MIDIYDTEVMTLLNLAKVSEVYYIITNREINPVTIENISIYSENNNITYKIKLRYIINDTTKSTSLYMNDEKDIYNSLILYSFDEAQRIYLQELHKNLESISGESNALKIHFKNVIGQLGKLYPEELL